MNLYYVNQRLVCDYDTYDSMVIAAETEEEARSTHPSGAPLERERDDEWYSWPPYEQKEHIRVSFLGTTEAPKGVICASFNAG
jgi:hypothetical protein